MAIQHRSKKKRKVTEQENKGPKIGSFQSSGINFQKVAHTKKNTRTDIQSWPSCIIAGYDDGKNSVFIQYKTTEDVSEESLKDIDELSGFFSEMAAGDIFTILNASYDDSIGKPTKTIEGTYKLISYNAGSIAAEKQSDLDSNFVMKKLSGKNFSRPLQYQKETELNSKKKISSIINYLDYPDFTEKNIKIGDVIEPSGTSFNNVSYVVLDVLKHNDGSQELKVSPEISENENRIGQITNFTHYKNPARIMPSSSSGPGVPSSLDTPFRLADEARNATISGEYSRRTGIIPPDTAETREPTPGRQMNLGNGRSRPSSNLGY